MNYKPFIFGIPIAFSCKIGPLNSLLKIYGVVCSSSYSKSFFV